MLESKIRILLIEDNPGDARLVQELLWGATGGPTHFEIKLADRLSQGLERLSTEETDVVLLDLGLPDSTGLDTVRRLREQTEKAVVVVLTGLDDEEVAVQCLLHGAQDYLVKGRFDAHLLGRSVRYAIERKRADEALQREHQRFNDILEKLPVMICLLTPDYHVPFANRRFREQFGESHDRHCYDYIFHRTEPCPECQSFTPLKTHAPHHWEWAHPRGSYLDIYDFPFTDSDGSSLVLEMVMDITDRKRAEDRERLASEVLELLNRPGGATDTIRDILLLVRKSTGIEAVGIRLQEGDDFPYYETNGFTEDFVQAERYLCERDAAGNIVRDGKGNPVLECMCGNIIRGRTDPAQPFFTENGSFWTNSTTKLLATTTEKERQGRTRSRCNREGYESVALIPLRSGRETIGLLQLNDRRPNQFTPEMIRFFEGLGASIGMAIARKRAEEALRQSEARFRSYFDMPLHGIAITSTEKAWLQVNDRICSMLGYTPDELVRMTWAEITHPDDLAADVEQFNRLLSGEIQQYVLDKRFIRKDGREIWTSISVGCVRDSHGNVDYIVGLMEDITERRHLEEQLRQSQKMEAVGRLAGGIAHDFNNILTAILGYSDLLLRRFGEGDPARREVAEIEKAAQRAASLTRRLLAFSRQQVLEPKVMNINRLVADMDRMLRRLIGEDIDLVTSLDAGLGNTKVDSSQLEQVVLNLVLNARDAMPHGGKITIETANVDLDENYARQHVTARPGSYVMLAISDMGCGMDAETQSRVFEPFFTTKEMGKGIGLGLSTVYGIVKQSGGHIWVYSEPGRGTTFKVYLPRVEGDIDEERAADLELQVAGGAETILVVEDDDGIRNLIGKILQMNGYTVLKTSSGAEALELAARGEQPIHLTITDVVMPGVDGRELAKRLAIVRPDLKVLFMSGYASDAVLHNGIVEEGNPFLQKPFTPESLARKVRRVLDDR